MRTFGICMAITVGALVSAPASAAVVISDDFEVDTSANYTVLDESNAASGDGTPDGGATFNFDYIAAGIPLAPNSTGGDTSGLKMVANETANDAGAADHVTAFHNIALTGNMTLQVDIFMGVDLGASGSTEFAHIGVGSDASDFNSIFTPIAGVGHFMSMTGEGGSSSDYRHFVNGTPVNSGDSSYLNADNTTNATAQLYQDLFPSPPSDVAGSPTNIWTTMTIEVNPLHVRYFLDGVEIIRTPNVGSADGFVSLGYNDPFSSVGPHFVVYDNLIVTDVPEPASLALLGLGGLAMLRRK